MIRRMMLVVLIGLTILGRPVVAEETGMGATAGETDALKAAWELEPQGLESDIAKMNEQWDAVEAQLKDAEHIKIRAGKVSWWSVGQQCLHILKVANAIGGPMQGLLTSKAPAAAGGSPMKAQALAEGFPRGVAQAPQGLGVHYPPDLEEIQAELKKTRELWAGIIERKGEIESATATFPHPVFGPMNAAEWLRFTTVHTSHHLQIVDDILADSEKRTASAMTTEEEKPETAKAEYAKYEMGFLPIFAKFGGEILAVDEKVDPVEGEWTWTRTVILRFPNRAALDAWYNSEAYQGIIGHRHASSEAKIGIVQGMPVRGRD